ncbi:8-amino-7-oxononanoate synthase [Agaribacterium haliotis]|uniref:8-amino-7-oxononanoate synthase n=1 Tax=Agaribacterium haliotis TaxID=2013869 RepID=UPI001EFCA537|nr:8-amino-7-oxononanoate synthase [Agaribacterium haliotis]
MSLDIELRAALAQRKALGRLRSRLNLASAQGVEVEIDGQPYLNFSSNDYLGLAQNSELREALAQAGGRWGLGSGASHLVCGHSSEHQQLEQELAAHVGRDRALLFSTGYMANIGAVQALLGRDDAVFEDKLNHASLLDGALLSRAKRQRYGYLNYEQLELRLGSSTAKRKLVLTDSVFSMDGDCADLRRLSALSADYGASLMVDDAHGLGLLGDGRGAALHFGLDQQQLPVYMATLGKALGSFGAFVAGSETLIEYLVQFARPYIYTTAMPPALAAASRVALKLMQEQGWRRAKVGANIAYFRRRARELDVPLSSSHSAIQPIVLGDDKKLMLVAEQLRQRAYLLGAIRPPTVPEGSARLRICLSAAHSKKQIDSLLQCLAELLESA